MEIGSLPASAVLPRPKSVTFAPEPVLDQIHDLDVTEKPKLEGANDNNNELPSFQEPTLIDLENNSTATGTTSLILTDVVPETELVASPLESGTPKTKELVPPVSEAKPPIDSLPDETLEHIFSFLDIQQRIRSESVCRRWRNISRKQPWKLPKKLVIDSESSLRTPILTDTILSSVLLRCGPSLRKFTLTTYGKSNRVLAWGSSTVRSQSSVVLSENAVGIIGKYCSNLVELKLIGIPISDDGLKELGKECGHLKYVTLQDSKFSDEGLQSFFKKCTLMEGLEIAGNDHITGECFQGISNNLQILRLHDSQHLKPALALESLISRCHLIQELRITQCDNLVDQQTLTKFCNKYQDTLKILHLEGYDRNAQLTQQIRINWCQIVSLLRSLQELSLRNCDDVGDDVMIVLAKTCLKLSILNVSGTRVSDEGLRHLASAPSLKVLDISDASGINGEGLDVLAGQGRLEELFARHNHMISPDESCSTLALFCPNFRVLDVSETIGVSNMLVTAFCICLKRGFVKGPIKLIVGGTAIRRNVETCDQLQVLFHNSCTQHVLFDLLSNYDDSDSDDSDW